VGESWLFKPDGQGVHAGGIGFGRVSVEALDVVFVARNPESGRHEVVALFCDAGWESEWLSAKKGGKEREWVTAYSSDVRTFKVGDRPQVDWPIGRVNRRWARGGNNDWERLAKLFDLLIKTNPRRSEAGGNPGGLMPSANVLEKEIKKLSASNRKRMLAEVRRAIRDQRLRPVVIANWGARCAACNLKLATRAGQLECEIAHVREVKDSGLDDSANALPLCRTHHWAFDRMMWGIRPDDRVVVVRDEYLDTPLKKIDGRKSDPDGLLDSAALKHRWKQFTKPAK
jgi:hypothetical protein